MTAPSSLRIIPTVGVRGFTLIEVLIALAIVAIATVIAVPSYQSSSRKSNRSDGESLLLSIKARQETALYRNGRFSTDLTELHYDSASGVKSSQGFYLASVLAPTADCPINTCYVLRATPQAGQAKDGILELTSSGIYRRDKNNDGDASDASEEGWRCR